MKSISKIILLLHTILEGLAGVLVILNPSIILNNENTDSSHLGVAKIYGIAAFTIGMLSYQIWKKFDYSAFDKMIVMILIVFHLLIGLQMYSFFQVQLTPNPGASILHLSIAALFAISYIKEKSLFL